MRDRSRHILWHRGLGVSTNLTAIGASLRRLALNVLRIFRGHYFDGFWGLSKSENGVVSLNSPLNGGPLETERPSPWTGATITDLIYSSVIPIVPSIFHLRLNSVPASFPPSMFHWTFHDRPFVMLLHSILLCSDFHATLCHNMIRHIVSHCDTSCHIGDRITPSQSHQIASHRVIPHTQRKHHSFTHTHTLS